MGNMVMPERGSGVESVVPDEVRKQEPIGKGAGGIRREYYKAGPVIEALERLPVDEIWGVGQLGEVVLAVTESLNLPRAILGLERGTSYHATDAVAGLLGEMGVAVTRLADGHGREYGLALVENDEQVKVARGLYLDAMARREVLGLERGAMARGFYENWDPLTGKKVRTPVEQDAEQLWALEFAEVGYEATVRGRELRSLEFDPKVQKARDFFTLVGCSPEVMDSLLTEYPNIVESRRLFQYWLELAAGGYSELVIFFGQVVKAKSDLDSAAELLTRQWNDKPGGSELFATLLPPEMNMGVTEVFSVLMDIDIVPSERIVTVKRPMVGVQRAGEGKTREIPVEVTFLELLGDERLVRYGLAEPVYRKDSKGEDVVGDDGKPVVEKVLAARSIFSGHQTPEQRRLWIKGMEDLVADVLRNKGVKDPLAWARQAVPVALAWYEILLLGARAGVRRDINGDPIKEPVVFKVKNGDGVEEERVRVDGRGKVVYRTEESGPATITGWLDDLEEKGGRTKDRLGKEGGSGHSAPPMLAAFAAPSRFLIPMFERMTINVGEDVRMSMMEAVRLKKRTVGECLGEMTETGRAIEALNLFRTVAAFNAITPPLADIRMITTRADADPKHLQEVAKYFTTLTKALRFLYGKSQPWMVTLGQVNAVAQMVRYAERTSPTQGGNPQNSLQKPSQSVGEGTTRVINSNVRLMVLRDQLCVVTNEMTTEAFDLALKLAVKKEEHTPRQETKGISPGRQLSDRVGLLRPEDVLDNAELMRILLLDPGNNPDAPYSLVATYGPDGQAYEVGSDERKEAIRLLVS